MKINLPSLQDETDKERALKQTITELQEEAARRAVLIGKLEGQVAKKESAKQLAESRATVAEGRLEQQDATMALMSADAVSHEASILAEKRRVANLALKSRDQKKAVEFILTSLEEREREVAELRVSLDIAKEKRCESKILFMHLATWMLHLLLRACTDVAQNASYRICSLDDN